MANYFDQFDEKPQGNYFDQFDEQPLQASIEKSPNIASDIAGGFWSGLTTIPRALNKVTDIVAQPISSAISYIPSQAIRKLQGKDLESFGDYSNRANAFIQEARKPYEPQTMAGNVAEFAGSSIPYLLAPQATTLRGVTAIGGTIGATESIARGDKPTDVLLNTGVGSLAGAGGQTALKGLGFAFEKSMPVLGRIAGIKSQNMQRAIERIKEGGTIFGKNQDEVDAMVNEALESMRNAGNLTKEEIDNITNNIINKYSKGTPINPQASAVKSQLGELESDIELATYGKKLPKEKPVQEDTFYNNIRNEIYNQVDQENALLPEETKQAIVDSMIERMGIKNINNTEKTVQEINPVSLHQIKSKLQHDVEFNKENRAYNKQGAALLKEIQKAYGDILKERYPQYAPAMQEYADAMAAKDFDAWVKTGSIYEIGRALTPVLGGITGSVLTGNPIFTALSVLSSPKMQQKLLEGYGYASRNIAPKLTPTATLAAEKMIPKRSDEYGK